MLQPHSAPPLLQRLKPYLSLIGWVILVLGLGSGMGIFFGPDNWYRTLTVPTWNPPGWVFGPAWTLLYIFIGISVWLVQHDRDVTPAAKTSAMRLFWLQLALNLAWTPIFFGLHKPMLAFIVISLLWISVLFTIRAFGKISVLAGYLLAPYLAWISFALILNGTIWLLNS